MKYIYFFLILCFISCGSKSKDSDKTEYTIEVFNSRGDIVRIYKTDWYNHNAYTDCIHWHDENGMYIEVSSNYIVTQTK